MMNTLAEYRRAIVAHINHGNKEGEINYIMDENPVWYIEKMSENVLNTTFANFEPETLANAKMRIIDLLGCLISGAHGPGSLALVNLVKTWGGREEASIMVHGGKVPAHNAAMVNSILARTFDFEAVGAFVDGVDLPSHISVTTVMTALALGEAQDISGQDLMTALLVGDDFACRLLAASGFGFSRGWDGNGTINAFGAAAIAGRLLGVTRKQMQNTFGIVLNQLGGSFQSVWDSTLCFKLPNGLSARNGIISAELAKAGWNGPIDALFSKYGYFALYTDGCADPEILIKNLGQKYYTEATVKPYPSCRANHIAIDCAIDIVSQNDVETDNIDKIVLTVPSRVRHMFVGKPFEINEIPQIDAAFSIRFAVANVLLRKGLQLEHYNEELIKDSEITRLVDKVQIEEFDKKGASLQVVMNDGKSYFAEAEFARGGPYQNSPSLDSVKEKFMYNVSYAKTISEKNAKEALVLIENLEEVEKISDLTKLMVIE